MLFSCASQNSPVRVENVCGGMHRQHLDNIKIKVREVSLESRSFRFGGDKTVHIEFSRQGQGIGKIYTADSILFAEFDTQTGDCAYSYYREYYPNGILQMEASAGSDSTRFAYYYVTNYRNGKFTGYDSAGNIAYTEYWLNGAPTGTYKAWHSNGQLKLEGRFDEYGTMNGLWKFYDVLGKCVKTKHYPLENTSPMPAPAPPILVLYEKAGLLGRPHSYTKELLEEEITKLSEGNLYQFKRKHKTLYLKIEKDGITSLWGKNEGGFYAVKQDMQLDVSPARMIAGYPIWTLYEINYQVTSDY